MSFPGVNVTHVSSNCKLSTIDYISNMPLDVPKVKKFLEDLRIVVHFNTTNKRIVEFFEKNFEVYDVSEIPVGYGGGYQYFVTLKNNDSKYPNKQYLREKEVPNKGLNLAKVEEIMTKTLKAKRRKTDIVKEVLDNLK